MLSIASLELALHHSIESVQSRQKLKLKTSNYSYFFTAFFVVVFGFFFLPLTAVLLLSPFIISSLSFVPAIGVVSSVATTPKKPPIKDPPKEIFLRFGHGHLLFLQLMQKFHP